MSRPRPARRLCLGSAAALAASGSLTGTAAAVDPIAAFWNGPQDYAYSVQWMPDIDQRWFTLPNDGAMYCVPTACMNLLAFASHWGDEMLQPGPGVWDDMDVTEQWDLADDLDLLGFLMETSPTGGTGLPGMWTGLDVWIGGRPFDVFAWGRTETDYPQLHELAQYGSAGGGTVVAFAYGRYDWDTVGGSTPRLLDRTGGHMVTLRQAAITNGVESLIARDPSSGDTTVEQSPYSNRVFGSVLTRTILNDADENGAFSSTTATTLGTSGSGRLQVLDAFVIIAPQFAAGFQGGDVAFTLVGGITGFDGGGGPGGIDGVVALPPGSEPLDLVLESDRRTALVLWRSPDGVHRIGRVTPPIPGTPPPAPEVLMATVDHQPTAIERDRHGRILLADGPTLLELRPGLPGGAPAALDALLVINHVIGDIVPDDARDRLLLTEQDGRRATMLDLQAPGGPASLPLLLPAVQSVREAARRTGAAGIDDDRFFLVDRTPRGDRIVAVRVGTDGNVETTEVVPADTGWTITSLAVDRRGHLVVWDDTDIVHVLFEGPAGFERLDGDDWYARAAGFDGAVLSRSRTNVSPELHDGPAWVNIDPSELDPGEVVPDCIPDIDQDGMVGLGDLLRVLAGWGGDGVADITPMPGGDGVTDFNDLLAVIGAWGPCP